MTRIESGVVRMGFAGRSITLNEGRAEYAETVGRTVRFQKGLNGK